MSPKSLKAASEESYQKWKADMKARKEPAPKQVFSEKQKKFALSFLNTPPNFRMNQPDDYRREYNRQTSMLKKQVEKQGKQFTAQQKAHVDATSKKCGKQVPQLGTQKKQSIAPLIVKGSSSAGASLRAQMDNDMELMDPAIVAAARASNMTVAQAKQQANEWGMPLRAMLGLEDAPISEVAFNYVLNGPLVESGQEKSLPTNMRMLLEWYDHFRKVNEALMLSMWVLERSITSKNTLYHSP